MVLFLIVFICILIHVIIAAFLNVGHICLFTNLHCPIKIKEVKYTQYDKES